MVNVGLWVRLEAKPGKEADVEQFLRNGLSIVQGEPATTTWYAIKLGPSTFGIYDTFQDESGRQAHLTGKLAAALKEKASELFAKPPSIDKIDILAAKLSR
ncbi:MAG: antibiotic biosynthesis monooxygenase [Nitrospira sp.]|nr:antibiotic biosynthesis monooxygenase [Nitrospira sp.]